MNRTDASRLLEEAQQCLDSGQLAEAKDRYQQLCQLDENCSEAWLGLGKTLLAQQQADAAVSPLEQAAHLRPRSVATLTSLGNCYLQKNRFDTALKVFTRIIELEPDNQYARLNLGKTYFKIGEPREAAAQLKVAVHNEPANIEAYAFLCNALLDCKELVEATTYLVQARRLWPANTGLLSALAMAYIRLGMIADAQPVCAELLRLQPDNVEVHSAYLYSFCYLPGFTPEARYREHARWGERHAPARAVASVHTNERNPHRRLRVGYVSADFFVHSVAYFLEPLLAHHDKGTIETFCYANRDKFDSKTHDLRRLADHWREIKSLDDAAVATGIRADGIDILVDLAGHTAGNRLGVFARKPAPVQVSYIGYPATTGMVAMDYRLTRFFVLPAAAGT
jgi:predicted O-linked N-acetylglucosamine transferase (SPINDLY family)